MKELDDIEYNEIQHLEHDKTISLEEKISRCINYFDNFPGADNNFKVKQIKDEVEFETYRNNGILVTGKSERKRPNILTTIKHFFGK